MFTPPNLTLTNLWDNLGRIMRHKESVACCVVGDFNVV